VIPRWIKTATPEEAAYLSLEHPGTPTARLWIPGEAVPCGSKKPVPIRGGPNAGRCTCVEDAKGADAWKSHVRRSAALQWRGPAWDCPIFISVLFVRPRPPSHYTARGALSARATPYPATKPDTTKLLRGVEDGLEGVAYVNDSRVVSQRAGKRWTDRGRDPGVLVLLAKVL